MAILVTGGAGYIGSHLCLELLNAGYEVVVVDNNSTSSSDALKRVQEITRKSVTVYTVDLGKKEDLLDVFSNHTISSVIHLAGYKSVSESSSIPLTYYANNIMSTLILCEVMQMFNVKSLVFSSSATVYAPTEKNEPISESHPLGAINPYGHTKQVIEEILRYLFYSDPSWSICMLRYFNPVGAHDSGQIGENPKGIPNNLVPYITNVAAGLLPALSIYGNDYPTRDGTGIRDYIHVVDLAQGHISALKKVETTTGINAYNLGTGKGYSVLEMVRSFQNVSGREIPYIIAPRRKGDIAVSFADVTKAKEELGWEAKRGIDAMCMDAWRWQRANPSNSALV
ncbi:UDP-glucose 4-epimerase GalE [Paucisalibacillus globulus]|uniref:UDP-glucose 4-epimerase GalE n=1 Tax=Paucisalibacillus globulus TaxID=351095 RepID=UPI000418011D|nr:UDP-glucose 4-epimerase GalE [Paucisalibacillus globulus]